VREHVREQACDNFSTVSSPGQASINVMPCHEHQRGRAFAQDSFRAVVRREDIQQPPNFPDD